MGSNQNVCETVFERAPPNLPSDSIDRAPSSQHHSENSNVKLNDPYDIDYIPSLN